MNLRINHRLGIVDVKYFSDFTVNLRYDSIASTFGIQFYFDPKNQQHAEMACVSHFHECILQHNGETLITGYILSQSFTLNSKKQLVSIGGYSKPGVLEDCEIPTSLYPLQTDGLTLREIALKLIAPFGIGLVVDGIAQKDSAEVFTLDEKLDAKIEKTNAKESQNIKSYLTSLAVQRNVILSHDEKGNLVFTEAKTMKTPIFHVEKGVIATEIKMTFNGQGIHSQITAIKQADVDGGDAGEHTVYNPYCPIVFRPKVIVQSSGDINTIEEFANNALAAELKNISFIITVDRWEVDNKLIRPNNIITVYCPEVYLYKKTKLFIQEVAFKGDAKSETAVLTCVLPSVYDRSAPQNVFVDAHTNFPRI